MKNYELVNQWAASLNCDKAFDEITKLKKKYPWLKCDESLKFIEKMNLDLTKIANVVKHQEKQNAMHRQFIEVSKIADESIVNAVRTLYKL